MRVLLVTYCMDETFGSPQIGVHKRGLRVGLELVDRGHDVVCFATGRHTFSDALTEQAEGCVRFVDWALEAGADADAERSRRVYLRHLAAIGPDVVVIGEAPMAGTLLETTLCAVECGIPTVLLDNAYHPDLVDGFCRNFGAMFDHIVLNAPSSLHGRTPYRHLDRVPPYVDVSEADARDLLAAQPGLGGRPLLLVLAYDRNVEALGLALAASLRDPPVDTVVLTPDPAGTRARAAQVTGGRVWCTAPPPDPTLFGLLRLARCAVTKVGYMQMTEALSLGTPVVGFRYPGDSWIHQLPRRVRAQIHTTTAPVADRATVAAARTFLVAGPDGLAGVHDGSGDAAARTAAVVEALPATPRDDTTADAARAGFDRRHVSAAVRRLDGRGDVADIAIRSTFLRGFPGHDLHAVLARYRGADGTPQVARLWGRLFASRTALLAEARAAARDHRRDVLRTAPRARLLLERDLGGDALPAVHAPSPATQGDAT